MRVQNTSDEFSAGYRNGMTTGVTVAFGMVAVVGVLGYPFLVDSIGQPERDDAILRCTSDAQVYMSAHNNVVPDKGLYREYKMASGATYSCDFKAVDQKTGYPVLKVGLIDDTLANG